MIKQFFDVGVQMLLILMVESVVQVCDLVVVVIYLFYGVWGVGLVLVWVFDFVVILDYLIMVWDEICLLVQVENIKGFSVFDEIVVVDGVDGVFIGFFDFVVDMGFIGKVGVVEVKFVVCEVIIKIVVFGKVVGILILDVDFQCECCDIGVSFIVIEIDVSFFVCNMCSVFFVV